MSNAAPAAVSRRTRAWRAATSTDGRGFIRSLLSPEPDYASATRSSIACASVIRSGQGGAGGKDGMRTSLPPAATDNAGISGGAAIVGTLLHTFRREESSGSSVRSCSNARRARYMTLETIAPMRDDPAVSLPAIAS
jgi:hypothetical protein